MTFAVRWWIGLQKQSRESQPASPWRKIQCIPTPGEQERRFTSGFWFNASLSYLLRYCSRYCITRSTKKEIRKSAPRGGAVIIIPKRTNFGKIICKILLIRTFLWKETEIATCFKSSPLSTIYHRCKVSFSHFNMFLNIIMRKM